MNLVKSLSTLVLFLVLFAGCGADNGLPQVKGKVTWKGEPLQDFIVNFKPDEGRPSVSGLSSDGSYEMSFTLKQKGVIKGKHKVFFTYSPQSQEQALDADRGKVDVDVKEFLKLYGTAAKSPLEVEILESQELNFDLPQE